MLPTVDILVTSNKNFDALLRRCFKQATIEKPEQPSVWAVRTRCPCSSNPNALGTDSSSNTFMRQGGHAGYLRTIESPARD